MNGLSLLRLWFAPSRSDKMRARGARALEKPDGWIVGLKFVEHLNGS